MRASWRTPSTASQACENGPWPRSCTSRLARSSARCAADLARVEPKASGECSTQRVEDPRAQRQRAQRVREARVLRRGKGQVGQAQLAQPPQPLHCRRGEQRDLARAELDEAVDRIVDAFRFHRPSPCHATPPLPCARRTAPSAIDRAQQHPARTTRTRRGRPGAPTHRVGGAQPRAQRLDTEQVFRADRRWCEAGDRSRAPTSAKSSGPTSACASAATTWSGCARSTARTRPRSTSTPTRGSSSASAATPRATCSPSCRSTRT